MNLGKLAQADLQFCAAWRRMALSVSALFQYLCSRTRPLALRLLQPAAQHVRGAPRADGTCHWLYRVRAWG